MTLEKFEDFSAALRHCYWHIRMSRSDASRRRWYRRAAKEKRRLAALGFDAELVRLYCLHLCNLRSDRRFQRYQAYAIKTLY